MNSNELRIRTRPARRAIVAWLQAPYTTRRGYYLAAVILGLAVGVFLG